MADRATDIQARMQSVRVELGEDIGELMDSTREMTNWKRYVQQYPWVCVGAAAFLGFSIIPHRPQIVSPDQDDLLRLAKRNKLVVKQKPEAHARKSWASTAFTFLAHAAVRAAVAYVGQKTGKAGVQQATEAPTP